MEVGDDNVARKSDEFEHVDGLARLFPSDRPILAVRRVDLDAGAGSVVSGSTAGSVNYGSGSTTNDVGFGNSSISSMSGDMSSMLQLQFKMQKENLMYTGISNVLKTKHETVKNSVSNIR